MSPAASRITRLSLIGLVVGFFSGLFGVGGGVVLVPLLIVVAGYGQRRASGTSLAAVLPTAIAGMISYASHGSVDWIAGGILAVGAVAGSLLGTWLLHHTHQTALRWIFIVFLLLVAARLFFLIPDRSVALEFTTLVIFALLALGIVTGILSGMLGIGGGVFIVPALMLGFGVGDLVAKGTSLFMIIPTALAGTISNVRRGNADIKAAAIVGALSVPATIGGAAVAWLVPPMLGSILFALLIIYCAIQLAWNALRKPRLADPT